MISQQSKASFTVYNSSTVPLHWEMKSSDDNNNLLFPPILLLASPDYIFNSTVWPLNMSHYHLDKIKGMHGYDPDLPDMHIPLFIYGPMSNRGFRMNYTQEIRPIHIHSLMAYLASIDLSSSDHQSLNHFTSLLISSNHESDKASFIDSAYWLDKSSFSFSLLNGSQFIRCLGC
ncbi:unnamed protein product [Trichobilharzia regenti]|nr:unnamed protein product [Trichobilharzia regenti]